MITASPPEPKRSVRIRQMHAEGMRPCDIARALGTTPNKVSTELWLERKRREKGPPCRRVGAVTERQEQVAALRAKGMGYKPIAKQLGISVATVYAHAMRAGVPKVLHQEDEDITTPRAASRARVQREVSEGKRCPRCWLLLPCDHQP